MSYKSINLKIVYIIEERLLKRVENYLNIESNNLTFEDKNKLNNLILKLKTNLGQESGKESLEIMYNMINEMSIKKGWKKLSKSTKQNRIEKYLEEKGIKVDIEVKIKIENLINSGKFKNDPALVYDELEGKLIKFPEKYLQLI